MSTSLKEIEKHFRLLAAQDAKNIKLCVNLDSIGAVAGKDIVTIAGKPAEINRVLVGGSFTTGNTRSLWVAYRHEDPPDLRHRCLGFRLAL